MKSRRGLIAAIGLCLLPATASADEWQFWPELDGFWSVHKSVRVVGIVGTIRDPDVGARTSVGYGAYIDFLAFQHRPIVRHTPDAGKHSILDLRFGYRYNVDEDGPRDVSENRYVGQFQLRFTPSKIPTHLYNRNRFELRDIEDRDLSWRYRNRSRVEDRVEWLGQHLTPCGMAEFFWDSRKEDWSRGVYTIGCEWSFPEGHTVLDFDLNVQDEWAPQVETILAPGLTAKFFF